ncbi:MAG: DUF1566 domain-containing protein [Nitrospinales bacterium]
MRIEKMSRVVKIAKAFRVSRLVAFRSFLKNGIIIGFLLLVFTAPVLADDAGKKNDPVFGGQILSLTDPGAVAKGEDSDRFKDNKDGTILDAQENKIWILKDSYQALKKWINWNEAQDYIIELNKKKFAGSDQWRLPTKEELASLYDEKKTVEWNYYWTRNEVHIDPIFGQSSCCYWSSQSYKNEEMAWGFNYIRGKAYVSMKGGIQKSLTVIRAIREK